MKYKSIILLTLMATLLFSGCSRKTQKTLQGLTEKQLSDILEKPIPQRNNYFAFDILKQVADEKENLVISPFSMSTALAMTYAGARDLTARQMATTLYFSPDHTGFHAEYGTYLQELRQMAGENVQLNIANSLWLQKDSYFLPEYLDAVEANYGSLLFKVDYKANREVVRNNINDWVLEQTGNKISDLIAPGALTEYTRLVLVNAIHFLGKWSSEFNVEKTKKETFFGISGQNSLKDFMFQKGYYNYYENEKIQVVEMPYRGGQYSMALLLPVIDSGIEDMMKNMDAGLFATVMADMSRSHVDLRIPRFEVETAVDLEVVLSEMGMPEAFSRRADFSGMTGTDSLMIDKVIHKAMIEVKEAGTEAAAATAVVMVTKTSIEPEPEKTIIFNANRPFLFVIKDNTYNSIIFIGQVVK